MLNTKPHSLCDHDVSGGGENRLKATYSLNVEIIPLDFPGSSN